MSSNRIVQASDLEQLLLEGYQLRGSITRLEGENENFLVEAPAGDRFVLKLCGKDQTSSVVELEDLAVETVHRGHLGIDLPRIIRTQGGSVEARRGRERVELRGRLLSFVEGTPWCQAVPTGSAQRRDLGSLLGRLARILAPVRHPAALRTHHWDLTATNEHRAFLALEPNPARRRSLEQAFFWFSASALPLLKNLPRGLIHGDLNDENILVAGGRVSGLLDFGDCLYNPIICDLAIALAYLLLDEEEPLKAGAEIIGSYHRERPLSPVELKVLFPLLCGRLAVSLTTVAQRRQIDPERSAWFVTEDRAWSALERYLQFDLRSAAEELAAETDLKVFGEHPRSREETLRDRRKYISSALSVTYQQPLKIVRGRAQFLYDYRESPYLDLYNNVCHVGHCHPRVVEAGCRQMRRLNTNTRYLYDELGDYAARLCNMLPDSLTHCFFVNSGSEANELALRLARTHTGNQDLLVVEGAYHGHTSTMIDISPYKFLGVGGEGKPKDWVHMVPLADGYRGAFKGQGRETGAAYGAQVKQVIDALDRPVAGFITESLLSCGGQIVPPEGYLPEAFKHVRAAGGVCICDEVQVGFGRIGTHFWGFELQRVVPDIVVLGKPIGNGHPMAAVITTREISKSFANAGMEFFATFGGNPVSCAIGMAVLDVIRDEKLQQNALEVGRHLLAGLQGLRERHELMGDVRGVGLFIGIELVRDRKTLEPAAQEAAQIVNGLRQRGVLTGTDGPFHNVIKIKPPMVITVSDADMVVRVLDDVLGRREVGKRGVG